ncbi:hypothetical protein J27TS8_26760 [Robertmurraya siralis]|uniref:Uncharacterized protein n=1 Tax=Robertmurraya siralis TaxID=77777 RepID=A0A919WIK2_9BACI|nr:hypothetical protein J27TS8_26760 [Robertmurraya siralis]
MVCGQQCQFVKQVLCYVLLKAGVLALFIYVERDRLTKGRIKGVSGLCSILPIVEIMDRMI